MEYLYSSVWAFETLLLHSPQIQSGETSYRFFSLIFVLTPTITQKITKIRETRHCRCIFGSSRYPRGKGINLKPSTTPITAIQHP